MISKKNNILFGLFKFDEIIFLVLWCSGYIGAKIGVPLSGTFTLLFYRYLVVFCVVLLYLLVCKKIVKPSFLSLKRNFIIGFFAHFIWLVTILKAFEFGLGAGSAALIASLQPALTALVVPWFLGEKNNTWIWLGIITGFIGVLMYSLADLEFNNISFYVYILPIIATLSLTFITVYERKNSQKQDVSEIDVPNALLWQSFITLLLLTPCALLIENFKAHYNLDFLFSVLWLALIVSLSAYGLMLYLIRTRSANRVSALQYFTPPTTMVIAFFAFSEQQNIYGYIGLCIVGIGFAILHYGETLKKGKIIND